jgi:hypothetical protein
MAGLMAVGYEERLILEMMKNEARMEIAAKEPPMMAITPAATTDVEARGAGRTGSMCIAYSSV